MARRSCKKVKVFCAFTAAVVHNTAHAGWPGHFHRPRIDNNFKSLSGDDDGKAMDFLMDDSRHSFIG